MDIQNAKHEPVSEEREGPKTTTSSRTQSETVLPLEEEPLALSPGLPRSSMPPVTVRPSQNSLTYFNCLSLVLGIQIGSGIFSTPAVISNHVSTPIAGVLVWTLAGTLAWTGASCFIELGTIISHNGGMQEYLRIGYGDVAGFMFSSIWLVIVRPCTIALIAMIFSEHINRLLLEELSISGGWLAEKIVALTAVWALTVVNCLGVVTGAKLAGWFLVLKLFMVGSIVLAGLFEGIRQSGGYLFAGTADKQQVVKRGLYYESQSDKVGYWDSIGEYVSALLAALWVYGGWEAVGFVAGEMKNPVRDIPRVLNSAMLIVVAGFTLASAAFHVVLPMSVIRQNNTPAITFAEKLYGHLGFLLYTVGICISAMGAINSNIFAVSRLVVSASQQGYLPRLFDTSDHKYRRAVDEQRTLQKLTDTKWTAWLVRCFTRFSKATRKQRVEQGVPIYAMMFTSLLTSFYILVGTFRGLITFIGLIEYLIFMFTVLVLLRLRHNPPAASTLSFTVEHPSVASSYRTYTANIILFCALSCFLVIRGVITDPMQGLMILVVTSGLYGLWRWRQTRAAVATSEEESVLEDD